MNERERLIELLKQNCHCKDEDCSNCNSNGICFTHRETDYLLDNGVVVLPCKINDHVWFIKSAYNDLTRRFTSNDIGTKVFLTKEAAEQAIQALKGGAE